MKEIVISESLEDKDKNRDGFVTLEEYLGKLIALLAFLWSLSVSLSLPLSASLSLSLSLSLSPLFVHYFHLSHFALEKCCNNRFCSTIQTSIASLYVL